LRIGNPGTKDAGTAVNTMIGHENDGGARYWAEYLLAVPEVLEDSFALPVAQIRQ
jgi:hypothetical protein